MTKMVTLIISCDMKELKEIMEQHLIGKNVDYSIVPNNDVGTGEIAEAVIKRIQQIQRDGEYAINHPMKIEDSCNIDDDDNDELERLQEGYA